MTSERSPRRQIASICALLVAAALVVLALYRMAYENDPAPLVTEIVLAALLAGLALRRLYAGRSD